MKTLPIQFTLTCVHFYEFLWELEKLRERIAAIIPDMFRVLRIQNHSVRRGVDDENPTNHSGMRPLL